LFDFTEGAIYVNFVSALVSALVSARLGSRDWSGPDEKSRLAYLEPFVPKAWLAH